MGEVAAGCGAVALVVLAGVEVERAVGAAGVVSGEAAGLLPVVWEAGGEDDERAAGVEDGAGAFSDGFAGSGPVLVAAGVGVVVGPAGGDEFGFPVPGLSDEFGWGVR